MDDGGRGSSWSDGPLFETRRRKGRLIQRVFGTTVAVSIIWIWIYRAAHTPPPSVDEKGRGRGWLMATFAAELWFSFFWVLTQSVRWNPTYRRTFKPRLSHRYEKELPRVDIFVCTADPSLEPPMMVINTVLSVMAYDYPPEKLAVYLSDDGGSDLTFYALTEAALFSKHWLPYCRNYNIEPRSPAAYFKSSSPHPYGQKHGQDFVFIQNLFENMKKRIENVTNAGKISEEIRLEHEGFSEWDSFTSPRDHDAIIQILIDGRNSDGQDIEGHILPTLVYLAREKRPQHPHNFKAGAMNALIRVSSMISNGPIILNVDCDMYSNSSRSVRDALCFFMDEEKGHEIAFVQFPQHFDNITKNDVYGSTLRIISEVEFHGFDGVGGPLYVGTGCFHRRETLLGKKFSNESRTVWKSENNPRKSTENVNDITERLKDLASCTYENNTQWGNEMGLLYGCPVEDVITGLSIHGKGWKSAYYNPERKGFLGVATTTLDQTLVQHKRWSEGELLILISKYNPAYYGLGRVHPCQQMGYLMYNLWSPGSLATLCYSIVPSLSLLNNVSLFPPVSSKWFLPFAYIIVSTYAYDFLEFRWSGGTALGWWNDQRMWLYKKTSSYIFALIDTITRLMGFSNLSFVISSKVADDDVFERYEKEMMEFGVSSPFFTILATLAVFNLLCFLGLVKRLVFMSDGGMRGYCETMAIQIVICVALVVINMPLYLALFVRKDKGKMPRSVTIKSVFLALFFGTLLSYLY